MGLQQAGSLVLDYFTGREGDGCLQQRLKNFGEGCYGSAERVPQPSGTVKLQAQALWLPKKPRKPNVFGLLESLLTPLAAPDLSRMKVRYSSGIFAP